MQLWDHSVFWVGLRDNNTSRCCRAIDRSSSLIPFKDSTEIVVRVNNRAAGEVGSQDIAGDACLRLSFIQDLHKA